MTDDKKKKTIYFSSWLHNRRSVKVSPDLSASNGPDSAKSIRYEGHILVSVIWHLYRKLIKSINLARISPLKLENILETHVGLFTTISWPVRPVEAIRRSFIHWWNRDVNTNEEEEEKGSSRAGGVLAGGVLKVTPIMCDGAEFNQREEQVDGGWS